MHAPANVMPFLHISFNTVVLINFTSDSYRAGVNATSVSLSVITFGSFDSQFIVEVVPDGTNLPEGGI